MKKNVRLIPSSLTELKKNYVFVFAFIVVLVFGTAGHAQPVMLRPLATGSTHFTTSNGKLYYSLGDSLFTSDGTPVGSTFVKKVEESILRISGITIGSYFFFITQSGSQQSLWKSDGTSSNTLKVGTSNTILPLLAYHSELYLKINDGINGSELWKLGTDNTLAILKDINPGGADGFAGEIIISSDLLFFKADAGTSGIDLWKSDGTTSGTVLAVDLEFDDFYGFTDVNGTVFMTRSFWGYESKEGELWKTEGSASTTVLVKKFDYNSTLYNDLSHLTAFNGKLYFFWNVINPDNYLYVSDGTEAGTQMIERVNIDGDIIKMLEVNGYLIFYTTSQGYLGPIWRSDGTAAGTEPFHQLSVYGFINPDFVNLTPTDSLLFFVDEVENEADLQLYQSDLTSENTKPLKELYNIPLKGSDNVVATADKVFFTTSSSENGFNLWYYDPAAPAACAGTGNILREVWTGIQGSSVSQIPVNTIPSDTELLTVFEGPSNSGDHYGSRLKGYLCVRTSGNYRFWISSNDNSELWLSTSNNPADKVKIAYVTGFTNPRQYTKYTSQQSALINLVAGHLYYIEALHKEGVGTDHVSVGMQLPDGTLERPIPGTRLLPFNNPPFVTITSPTENQTFQAPATITIEVNAEDSDGTIVKVECDFSGRKIGEDFTPPYTFTVSDIPQGDYSIQAKAIDNKGKEGVSTYRIIRVKGCVASGTILREVWTGIQGSRVSDIPQDSPPNSTNELTIFEGPSNIGIHYGTRIRGYICAPYSGPYAFYIASNDHSELWLSTDDNPVNKVKIAYVVGSTGIRQWEKYSSQRSGTIWLVQNKRYYIEALHKQGVGSDNIAVGWIGPDLFSEMPIPGSRLSPYSTSASSSVAQARSTDDDFLDPHSKVEAQINLSPNPAGKGLVSLNFSRYDVNEENNEVNVQVTSMMGEIVYSGPISCEGSCESIQLDITDKFTPGVYIVNGIINRKRFSKRLVVR